MKRMTLRNNKLTKHLGTSRDYQGTEFSYTCYVNKYYEDKYDEILLTEDRSYICNEFPTITGKSLKELKEKLSRL